MPRRRVKICGIMRPEDALLAAELGADAIGLNFVGGPRRINLDIARQILMVLPSLVTPVALVSDPTVEHPNAPTVPEIRGGPLSAGRGQLDISTFQCYGAGALLVGELGPPLAFWTVCRIGAGDIAGQVAAHLSRIAYRASTVVFDTAAEGKLGGTGKPLDWADLRHACDLLMQKELFQHFVLAGGLTPANVAEAIRIARPWAVDVSSGVEVPGKPGIKDPIKMRDFIQAAQQA